MTAKPDDVLIHVRFRPSSDVDTIDACPANLSKAEWYKSLRLAATRHYRTFAGGRGFFRIPRDTFKGILSSVGGQLQAAE